MRLTRVMCIYLNAQSMRICHCWCMINHLKEIDKEKVHCTINLAPGLSLHKFHPMHQKQACFPVHKEMHLVFLHGSLKNCGSGLSI